MEPVKFTFDQDFSGDTPSGSYNSKQQKINDDALAQGKELGYEEAMQSLEKSCEFTLEDIKNSFSTILHNHDSQVLEMEKHTTSLVLSIIRKIAPAMVNSHPLNEIEKLVKECLRNNPMEPRMAIRVDDRMLPLLRQKIDTIQTDCDFHGQIVLISDEMKNISDCRVEWTNGGAERDYEVLLKTIEEKVQIFIDAPTGQDDNYPL